MTYEVKMTQKKTTENEYTFSGRIIEQKGESVLIEITQADGYPFRGYVPAGEITIDDETGANAIPAEVLEAMTPFGLLWEKIVGELPPPSEIAGRLRQSGIYTLDDLNRKPQAVVEVLRGFYNISLGTLRRLARDLETKKES